VKRICVYCGSSPGTDPEFMSSAYELGGLIASRGLELVYGGAKVGTMGAVADGALARDGEVIGVLPEVLVEMEVAHDSLSELHAVRDMHERKAKMAALADAFITLPGSYGTFDETFEALVWLQLGVQRKPVGFLNTRGYYDPLFTFLDRAREEGFCRPENRALPLVDDDPSRLLDALLAWSPPPHLP